MRARYLLLPSLAAAALAASCTIPGDAAWSDLHASAFVAAFAAGTDASGRNITVTDSSGGGFDFGGDLEVERNTEVVAFYGARAGIAPLEGVASHFAYAGSNDGLVSGATEFAGVPIAGDLAITADLDLAVTKLLLGFDVINTPAARVGLLAGVDYLEFDRFDLISREFKTGSGGTVQIGDVQTILENESTVVPIVGVRADARIPWIGRVGGELSGLKADFEDADVLFLDLNLAAMWEPWDHVELVVGYRAVTMDLDGRVGDADLDIEVGLDGPYAGLSFYW